MVHFWIRKQNRNFLQLTGLFIAVSFLFTTVSAPFAEANLWEERRAAAKELRREPETLLAQLPSAGKQLVTGANFPNFLDFPKSGNPANNLSHLDPRFYGNEVEGKNLEWIASLPQNIATLKEATIPSFWKKGDPVVIYIQDAHLNKDAQSNIGKSIQHFIDQGKLDLVALEGAFETIDVSRFRQFPNQEAVHKVADYLLRENKISGSIHTAFTSKKDIPLFIGVDDREHYNANVEAYKQSFPHVSQYKEEISKIEEKIEQEKIERFNPALLLFDQGVQSYRDGKEQLGKYIRILTSSHSGRSRNPVNREISAFLQALEMEESLDFSKVEKERTLLLEKLTQNLSQSQMRELLNVSLAYRLGNINNTHFYIYLKELCQKSGIHFNDFPVMERYLQYVLLTDNIHAENLFDAVKDLEEKGYTALVKSEEEKRLVKESQYIYLLGKLINSSLTRQEWEEYSESAGASVFFKTHLDLTNFEAFYQESIIRDQKMAANVLKAIQAKKAKATLLVTGGFHSDGIEEALKRSNIAVITYTPKITKVDTDNGSAYLSVFTQEKTPLQKLFDGEKLFLPPKIITEGAIRTGAALLSEGNNPTFQQLTGPEIGEGFKVQKIEEKIEITNPHGDKASFSVENGEIKEVIIKKAILASAAALLVHFYTLYFGVPEMANLMSALTFTALFLIPIPFSPPAQGAYNKLSNTPFAPQNLTLSKISFRSLIFETIGDGGGRYKPSSGRSTKIYLTYSDYRDALTGFYRLIELIRLSKENELPTYFIELLSSNGKISLFPEAYEKLINHLKDALGEFYGINLTNEGELNNFIASLQSGEPEYLDRFRHSLNLYLGKLEQIVVDGKVRYIDELLQYEYFNPDGPIEGLREQLHFSPTDGQISYILQKALKVNLGISRDQFDCQIFDERLKLIISEFKSYFIKNSRDLRESVAKSKLLYSPIAIENPGNQGRNSQSSSQSSTMFNIIVGLFTLPAAWAAHTLLTGMVGDFSPWILALFSIPVIVAMSARYFTIGTHGVRALSLFSLISERVRGIEERIIRRLRDINLWAEPQQEPNANLDILPPQPRTFSPVSVPDDSIDRLDIRHRLGDYLIQLIKREGIRTISQLRSKTSEEIREIVGERLAPAVEKALLRVPSLNIFLGLVTAPLLTSLIMGATPPVRLVDMNLPVDIRPAINLLKNASVSLNVYKDSNPEELVLPDGFGSVYVQQAPYRPRMGVDYSLNIKDRATGCLERKRLNDVSGHPAANGKILKQILSQDGKYIGALYEYKGNVDGNQYLYHYFSIYDLEGNSVYHFGETNFKGGLNGVVISSVQMGKDGIGIRYRERQARKSVLNDYNQKVIVKPNIVRGVQRGVTLEDRNYYGPILDYPYTLAYLTESKETFVPFIKTLDGKLSLSTVHLSDEWLTTDGHNEFYYKDPQPLLNRFLYFSTFYEALVGSSYLTAFSLGKKLPNNSEMISVVLIGPVFVGTVMMLGFVFSTVPQIATPSVQVTPALNPTPDSQPASGSAPTSHNGIFNFLPFVPLAGTLGVFKDKSRSLVSGSSKQDSAPEENVARAVVEGIVQIYRGEEGGVISAEYLEKILGSVSGDVQSIAGPNHPSNRVIDAFTSGQLDRDKLNAALQREFKKAQKRLGWKLSKEEIQSFAARVLYNGFKAEDIELVLAQGIENGENPVQGERPLSVSVIDPSQNSVKVAAEIIERTLKAKQEEQEINFLFYIQSKVEGASAFEKKWEERGVHVHFETKLVTDANFSLQEFDASVSHWVAKQGGFSSYSFILPKLLLGNLSELENLPADSLLRISAIILIDKTFKATPILRYQDLDQIRQIAENIATQA